MRKQYEVTVLVTRENFLKLWAADEYEAKEFAIEKAERWDRVCNVSVAAVKEV